MEKPVLNNKIYGVYQRCNLVLMVPVRWWSSIQRSSNCIPLKTDVRLKWMSPTSVRQPTIYLHHWETIIKFKGNRLAIVLLSVWSRPADFVWKLSIAFVAFYQDENENVEPRERPIFWCPLSFFLMSFLSVFLSFCLFVCAGCNLFITVLYMPARSKRISSNLSFIRWQPKEPPLLTPRTFKSSSDDLPLALTNTDFWTSQLIV